VSAAALFTCNSKLVADFATSEGFATTRGTSCSSYVQRLFSAFPDGVPGSGLLFLRVVAGTTVAVLGIIHVRATVADITAAAGALAIVSGSALVIGLLTPIAGVCAAAIVLLSTSGLLGDSLVFNCLAAVLLSADAIAIAVIGPGAFSVDARLFGRREVLIPREPRERRL